MEETVCITILLQLLIFLEELIQHQELLEFFIPIFRADGILVENYWKDNSAKTYQIIDVNITFFGSNKVILSSVPVFNLLCSNYLQDPMATEVNAWSELTSKNFEALMNDDSHLFLMSQTRGKEIVMKKIESLFAEYS